jgi:acetyl esterase
VALDPVIQGLLAQLEAAGATTPVYELDLASARAGLDLIGSLGFPDPPAPVRVEEHRVDAGDRFLTVEVVWGAEAPRVGVLFLHGGGFVLGSLAGYRGVTRHLAHRLGAVIASVGYRLAPEHPYPAAVEDTFAALQWLRAFAQDEGLERLGVAGDSAGGNLAAVASLGAMDLGVELTAALELYPATDFADDLPSLTRFAEGYFLRASEASWFAEQYLQGNRALADDWRVSPVRAASVDEVPMSVVATAGYDPIGDAGRRWAARLAEAPQASSVEGLDLAPRLAGAGVEVQGFARGRVVALDFPTLIHGFASIAGVAPAARAACNLAYDLFGELLGAC